MPPTARTKADGINVWRNVEVAGDAAGGLATLQWDQNHAFYIKHDNGYSTWYLHAKDFASPIKEALVKDGYFQVVTLEKPIAYVGDKGAASGAFHLHFGVRRGNTVVDAYGDGSRSSVLWVALPP